MKILSIFYSAFPRPSSRISWGLVSYLQYVISLEKEKINLDQSFKNSDIFVYVVWNNRFNESYVFLYFPVRFYGRKFWLPSKPTFFEIS